MLCYNLPPMFRWRPLGLAAGLAVAILISLAAVSQFLAPSLTYEIKEGIAETVSGNRGSTYRIALGVRTGSYYGLGVLLNRYLKEKAGYELELVATAGVPENIGALLDPARDIHLAMTESSADDGAAASELAGLAAVGRQYFFVIVPNDSTVRDVRDLAGPINPGQRDPGHAPTLGEKVLEYYGLIASPSTPAGKVPAATIVRPTSRGNLKDFEAGHQTATTRTQFLQSDLIDGILKDGTYRLVPIRDHEALARALPGTEPGFIPAGVYGPERRIPPEPVPTLAVTSLLIARRDLPGRVARDILEVVYDPRFARDIHQELTEESGRKVGVVPLHRAADIFYHRNDLVTSDRISGLAPLNRRTKDQEKILLERILLISQPPVDEVFLNRRRDHRTAPARELNAERLDLVVHHARADAEQLRRVLLHPVRHLQRFRQRAPLDLFERHA